MSTFAEHLAKRPPEPPLIVVLKPEHFLATFTERPTVEVAVGLRTLSHDEVLVASSEAAKIARAGGREGEEAVDRYNEELMIWAVGAGTTDPNDARRAYFALGGESARHQLAPEGVRFLWDAIERAHALCSPLTPPASDQELRQLGALLQQPEAIAALHPTQALRVRRWGRVLLEMLLAPASATR